MLLDAWNEGVSDVWNFYCQCGRWEIYVTFSLGNFEGKENCTDRHRWGDNIQMNLRNVGWEWTRFNSLIKVSMVGSCLHGYEFFCFMRKEVFCPLH